MMKHAFFLPLLNREKKHVLLRLCDRNVLRNSLIFFVHLRHSSGLFLSITEPITDTKKNQLYNHSILCE